MFTLNKKVAVITGGGSGIGKAIAELFSHQGATVFVLELNAEAADETVKKCKAGGGKAEAYDCNVSDQSMVLHVKDQILKQTGQIDILVNSAGIAHIGKLSKTQPIGRMGRPDEIASLALYLCSYEAAFVTGSDYPIDGGFIRLK